VAAAVVRFESLAEVLRLDLQAGVCRVGAEFNPGDENLEITTLGQPPYGEVDVAWQPKITEMLLPLRLEGTWAAMRDFHGLLAVELGRPTNVIRYVPAGSSDIYFFDTFRSFVPTLHGGTEDPTAVGRTIIRPIIRRVSPARGAAPYI
jgi:hypothetical protein